MKVLFLPLLILPLTANFTYNKPYNGGNQFHNLHSNPALLKKLLQQVNISPSAACEEIPGVGPPVLSLKKAIQDIDTSLDASNANTYAKIIHFKEKEDRRRQQTTYQIVVQIRSFQTVNFLAVEGLYRKLGFPTFSVENYLFDSDLNNIRLVMGDNSISESGFFGCGDVKSIYSQANPVLPNPNPRVRGVESNPSQSPYARNNGFVNRNPNRHGNNTPDPAVIAQIVQLLSQPASPQQP